MNSKTVNLAPFQQRVFLEKTTLDTKIEALSRFVASDTYAEMAYKDPQQANLLGRQLKVMREYSEILDQRIKLFT